MSTVNADYLTALGGVRNRSLMAGANISMQGMIGLTVMVVPPLLALMIIGPATAPTIMFFAWTGLSVLCWIELEALGGHCLGQIGARLVTFRWRRLHGRDEFIPAPADTTIEVPASRRRRAKLEQALTAEDAGDRSALVAAGFVAPDTPDVIGALDSGEVATPAGPLAWVGHPGRGYVSIAFEMHHGHHAVVSTADWVRPNQDWGRFLALLHRSHSRVTGVQQVTRSVGWDPTDHIEWINDHVVGENRLLADSYEDLVDRVASQAVQHRTWLVCRLPRLDGDRNVAVVAEQAGLVAAQAAATGIALRPLSSRRLAAVIRGFQDPDRSVDDLEDIDLACCWQGFVARPDCLEFDSGWLHQGVEITAANIKPGLAPLDMLRPLLSGLGRDVPLTTSITANLISPEKARRRSRSANTSDKAAAKKAARKTSDGSEVDALEASTAMIHDLRPGAGNIGVEWRMTTSWMARTSKGLSAAARAVPGLLDEAWISSTQSRRWIQDQLWAASLPLARGIAKSQTMGGLL